MKCCFTLTWKLLSSLFFEMFAASFRVNRGIVRFDVYCIMYSNMFFDKNKLKLVMMFKCWLGYFIQLFPKCVYAINY